ncbi:hypothetical protein EDB84DRAFT_1512872 [Lactarius hengduanensis]|nr:hypothetical protein EDB84DRAFT_1512872 [Lactarius hengduanensis]
MRRYQSSWIGSVRDGCFAQRWCLGHNILRLALSASFCLTFFWCDVSSYLVYVFKTFSSAYSGLWWYLRLAQRTYCNDIPLEIFPQTE